MAIPAAAKCWNPATPANCPPASGDVAGVAESSGQSPLQRNIFLNPVSPPQAVSHPSRIGETQWAINNPAR